MRHRFIRPDEVSRGGFTIVELVICVVIILALLSLLLPATRSARGAARRLECANNVKQLALAAHGRASSHGDKIPRLTESAPGLAESIRVGWLIQLLPYLDNAGAIETIITCATESEAADALRMVLKGSFKAAQCPEDTNHFRQPGGLSYGANIGYGAWRGSPDGVQTSYDLGATDHSAMAIDWNRNGKLDTADREVAHATGVFWSDDSDEPQQTFDSILKGDGTSVTILFAETTNLPPMHQAGIAKEGSHPRALELGIGLGYDALGLAKSKHPTLRLDGQQKATTEYTKFFSPNSNSGTAIGKWPAASSLHSGGVNVVYADGHVGFVQSDVDWSIWASLHTPNGNRYGEVKLQDADF